MFIIRSLSNNQVMYQFSLLKFTWSWFHQSCPPAVSSPTCSFRSSTCTLSDETSSSANPCTFQTPILRTYSSVTSRALPTCKHISNSPDKNATPPIVTQILPSFMTFLCLFRIFNYFFPFWTFAILIFVTHQKLFYAYPFTNFALLKFSLKIRNVREQKGIICMIYELKRCW